MSHLHYLVFKQLHGIKHCLKFCVIFALLPGFYTYRKSLNKIESWQKIMKKYLTTVLTYAVMGAAPTWFGCLFLPYFRSVDWLFQVSTFICGVCIGLLIDTPDRHMQLVAYFIPKVIEVLLNLQHIHLKGPKVTKAIIKYFVVLSMALVGYFEYITL